MEITTDDYQMFGYRETMEVTPSVPLTDDNEDEFWEAVADEFGTGWSLNSNDGASVIIERDFDPSNYETD